MRIALDALGGDFGAKPNVLGALKAVKDFGFDVILVGDSNVIKQELDGAGDYDESKISIIHAYYYNYERPAAALGYKSPVQYKTELGF